MDAAYSIDINTAYSIDIITAHSIDNNTDYSTYSISIETAIPFINIQHSRSDFIIKIL